MIDSIDAAKDAGYTKLVVADGGLYTFFLLVKPGTDYDGEFQAYDTDEGGIITVYGWLFDVEDNEHDAD